MGAAPLWAITCYFNPAGYDRRLSNYRLFRAHLGVPLVTVELSYGARGELGPGDADILVQRQGLDVMWQKERLLNLALAALPADCRAVAWLDADLLFADAGWAARATRLLDDVTLVQLFRQARYLGRDWTPGQSPETATALIRPSVAWGVESGLTPDACFTHPSPAERPGTFTPGLAWAGRRDLLQRRRLFDANVIGGGDRAVACAAYGCFDHEIEYHFLNERQRRYYLAWAVPFHGECGASVTSLDGEVYHLWHGDVRDRSFGSRHADFRGFRFDPSRDIALDEGGCWRWNSEKPEMHRYVRRYFASRREDG
jgi:hypothetical protein